MTGAGARGDVSAWLRISGTEEPNCTAPGIDDCRNERQGQGFRSSTAIHILLPATLCARGGRAIRRVHGAELAETIFAFNLGASE